MIAAIQGQSGAGMVHMFIGPLPTLTEADALARLPFGSSIRAAHTRAWCVVSVAADHDALNAFAWFCAPRFVFSRNSDVLIRRSSLEEFVRTWEQWEFLA